MAINFAQHSRVQQFISRTTALSLLISFYNVTSATVNLPYLLRLLSCRSAFSFLLHLCYTDTHRKSKIKLKEGRSSLAKVGNFIHYVFLSRFCAVATQEEL